MEEQNQTNKKQHKNNSLVSGLLGGIIGGVAIFGIMYFSTGLGSNTTTTSTGPVTGIVDSKGETKVSDVNYDVNSDITKAVNKVEGAVVSVINLQRQQQYNNPFGNIFGGGNSNSSNANGNDLQTVSEGSGVVYKKVGNDAYIVTNNHVVEGQDGLEVLLSDGTKVKAELVGADSYSDLAVIKIPGEHVKTVAEFGDSDNLKVGEPAIAIGSPLGSQYANTVTQGIISSIGRDINSTNEEGQPVNINGIQTDAAINPGNSGGPLINTAGQVIGINSIKIVKSNNEVAVEGLGFAIPSNDVVNIINQLEKDGKVSRPALGIRTTELTQISTQQREQILGLPQDVTTGVVVVDVENATPAQKAGLKQYDVIVKADGTDVDGYATLTKILRNKKVGDTVKLEVYRGKEKKTIEVHLTIDSDAMQSNANQQQNNK